MPGPSVWDSATAEASFGGPLASVFLRRLPAKAAKKQLSIFDIVRKVPTPTPAEDSAETKARRDRWVPLLGKRWFAALDAKLRRVIIII